MLDEMTLKGRQGNARFDVLAICGKGPAGTLGSALQTHLSAQKPVIMFGFFGTWQFSSKAVT